MAGNNDGHQRRQGGIAKVALYLTREIESGRYAPGDRLPPRADLAREFNLSESAISCALKLVSRKHPLTFVPGRGVFVKKTEPETRTITIGLIGRYAKEFARTTGRGPGASFSYYRPILQNIITHANRRHCALVAIPRTDAEPLDVERIVSYGVKCLICLICHGVYPRWETCVELKRRGIPLVLGHRGDDSLPRRGVSYVDYDWAGGFRQAVRLFYERGHRRIGFCAAAQATGGGHVLWRSAFLLECAELGLPHPARYCRIGPHGDYHEVVAREVRHLLTLPDPPTAIIVKCPWYHMEPFFEVLRGP